MCQQAVSGRKVHALYLAAPLCRTTSASGRYEYRTYCCSSTVHEYCCSTKALFLLAVPHDGRTLLKVGCVGWMRVRCGLQMSFVFDAGDDK